jgi:hypothetical protein
VFGLPSGDTLAYNSGVLDIVTAYSGPPIWQYATSGSWTDNTKWAGGIPSSSGATAIVGAVTTMPVTITLDSPQTLGTLEFTNTPSSAAGYTLDAGTSGSLTLDNTDSTAHIAVNGGSHEIAAPLYVSNGTLEVTAGSGGALTISGSISDFGAGASLLLNGDGTGELILSGANNLGGTGGTATVSSGTLVLNNGEALADGTSLTVGDASFFAGGTQPAGGALSAAGTPLVAAQLSPVPEPGTLVLAMAVVVAGYTYRRRRR